MIQEKIAEIIALYSVGDERFLAVFRSIQSQLSTEENWQLIRGLTDVLRESGRLAEEAHALAQAA